MLWPGCYFGFRDGALRRTVWRATSARPQDLVLVCARGQDLVLSPRNPDLFCQEMERRLEPEGHEAPGAGAASYGLDRVQQKEGWFLSLVAVSSLAAAVVVSRGAIQSGELSRALHAAIVVLILNLAMGVWLTHRWPDGAKLFAGSGLAIVILCGLVSPN